MNSVHTKSSEVTEVWAGLLDPGETILWQGRPATGIRIKAGNLATSAFGLFFGGLPLLSLLGLLGPGLENRKSLFLMLFLTPFIAIGLYLCVGQYFWEAFRRSRTSYLLTSKRAIITVNTFNRSHTTWPITKDTKLEYQPGVEAKIYFAKVQRQDSEGGSFFETVGFEYIKDGREVYALIRKIQGSQP